jgi:hypothetical protein
MTTKVYTCWYKRVGDTVKFNHLADGYDPTVNGPLPMFPSQASAWKDQQWIGIRSVLVDGEVILDDDPDLLDMFKTLLIP